MKAKRIRTTFDAIKRRHESKRGYLSASSISSFQTCPRMYEYDKLRCIRPAEKSDALLFGSVVHKGLEIIFERLNDELLSKEQVRQFAKEAALEKASECSLSQEDLCKVNVLMDSYIDLYFDEDRALFDVIEVESRFANYAINPRTNREDKAVAVQGFCDAVIRNRMTGEYWVVEHKTASQVTEGYLQRVNIDLQCAIYIDAIRRKYGNCAGVIYDVLKKPKHVMSIGETDEEFEARKSASKTGRIKRKMPESLTDFYNRMRADVEDGFLVRQMVALSDDMFADYRRDLWTIGWQINKTRHFCKSTCNCLKYGVCPYMDLCCANGNLHGLEDKYTVEAPF